jgi:dihydrofolate reductase
MATTINGIIAKEDDSAEFLTEVEAQSYVDNVIEAGAVIVGRRTYEVLSEQPEFQKFIEAKVKMVVLSRGEVDLKDPIHKIANTPKEAIKLLQDNEKVIIAGGGKANAVFMSMGLVDELFIDIEPAIVGQGMNLFEGLDFDAELEFLGSKMLSDNEIQLHYRVIKS